jgi:hypothetical protein
MKLFTPIKVISVATLVKLGLLLNIVLGCFVFSALAYGNTIQPKEMGKVLQIKPYDLYYTVDLGGITIQSRRQLHYEDGLYRIKNIAKSFLGKVTEHGSFDISKDGNIIPLKYSKQQKTIMGKHSETQLFDWDKNTRLYTIDKTQGMVDLFPGHFDSLSLTQQLRLDLAFDRKKMAYTIIRKDKFKSYQFKSVGHEMITIGDGRYNSLVVERINNDSSKETRIWFASDWDFVLLKMETFEKNSKKVMVLDKGILNTHSIVPIKNTTEIQE